MDLRRRGIINIWRIVKYRPITFRSICVWSGNENPRRPGDKYASGGRARVCGQNKKNTSDLSRAT